MIYKVFLILCTASRLFTAFKAKENIRKAIETRSPSEKQNCLAESLRYLLATLSSFSLRE